MMRQWIILAAASLQVLVLGFMAGQREAVLHGGQAVKLRSAPIDPRDLFRGDYVRLSYEASNINRSLWRGDLSSRKAERGERVYAVLEVGDDGLARVTSVTDERPDEGPFLRGRVGWHGGTQLSVKYGLEAYFMQQGTALELERNRVRDADGQVPVQVPLDMDVAVGGSGIAVLRGHQWAPVGLGLRLERQPRTTGRRRQPWTEMTTGRRRQPWTGIVELALLNASEQPLAIVDLPDGGSFDLLPSERWRDNPCRWIGENKERPSVRDADVRLLAPGERHTLRINLRDEAWFVTGPEDTSPRTLVDRGNRTYWFRLVYRPPSPETIEGLAHAAAIWHGELLSRAFNGRQMVD